MTVELAISAGDIREVLSQIDVSYARPRQRGRQPRVPFVADVVPAVSARPGLPEVGIVRIDAADWRQENQQRYTMAPQQAVGGLDPGSRCLDLSIVSQSRCVLPVCGHVEGARFPAHKGVEHPVEKVFLLAVMRQGDV